MLGRHNSVEKVRRLMINLVENCLVVCVHIEARRRNRLPPSSQHNGMIVYGFVVAIGILAYYLTERSREKA